MPISESQPYRSVGTGEGIPPGHRVPPRVVVDAVRPAIDAGRFPIKRTVGETVRVEADIFADGHDMLGGVVKYRHLDEATERPLEWHEVPLTPLGNDAWTASFEVARLGTYEYTVEAWIDRYETWLHGLTAKFDAGQDVASELLEGVDLVRRAAAAAPERSRALGTSPDAGLLRLADALEGRASQQERVTRARSDEARRQMAARPDRTAAATFDRALTVTVDPVAARFSAWYEMFPRSCTPDPSRGGTFRDAEARLPDIAALGFDIVYLPPVHPIGRSHRKGPNNALTAQPGDPGSPWAIGSDEGGHTAIEPGLGTIGDFDRFVAVANRLGLKVALDIAFQTSPDHPWVREHPSWFRHRPDGSIKYAENPPKKYQDIYPLDFESPEWRSLWEGLRDVFLFWIGHGVHIFRVDNPHTKSFRFWEWCIAELRRAHPDVVLLSEAFTRPKVMQYLAKAGFNQSYTYFTWRNTAAELRDYLTELTTTEVREYLRPNFFANTPDILHEYLQRGGRPAFEARLVLAATLSASYGIYSGFELCENVPVREGSEEYLDSEKYQIRIRNWQAPGIRELIARVNTIRREHSALQQTNALSFHASDNGALLWFSKDGDGGDRVFVAVNTDPHAMQHGFLEMPLDDMDVPDDATYEMEDLLDGSRYTWNGRRNYVKLDPAERMAHIFVMQPA